MNFLSGEKREVSAPRSTSRRYRSEKTYIRSNYMKFNRKTLTLTMNTLQKLQKIIIRNYKPQHPTRREQQNIHTLKENSSI